MNKCGKGKDYKEEMKETTHLSLILFLYLSQLFRIYIELKMAS